MIVASCAVTSSNSVRSRPFSLVRITSFYGHLATHPRYRAATNLRGKSQQEEKHENQRFNFRKLLGCRRVDGVASNGQAGKEISVSKPKRIAPQTTQVTRYNQNISPRMGNTRYYGTRSYAGRQYTGTRYYSGTRYYGNNYYGGGTRYYYGGGLPVLQLLLGLAVLKLGLRNIGILPVLVLWRLSV